MGQLNMRTRFDVVTSRAPDDETRVGLGGRRQGAGATDKLCLSVLLSVDGRWLANQTPGTRGPFALRLIVAASAPGNALLESSGTRRHPC